MKILRILLLFLFFFFNSFFISKAQIVLLDSIVLNGKNNNTIFFNSFKPETINGKIFLLDNFGSQLYLFDLKGDFLDSINLLGLGSRFIPNKVISKNDLMYFEDGYEIKVCNREKQLFEINIPYRDENQVRYLNISSNEIEIKEDKIYQPSNIFSHSGEENEWSESTRREHFERNIISIYSVMDTTIFFEKNIVPRPISLIDSFVKYPWLDNRIITFNQNEIAVSEFADSTIRFFNYEGDLINSFGRNGKYWMKISRPDKFYDDTSSIKNRNKIYKELKGKESFYGKVLSDKKYLTRIYLVPINKTELTEKVKYNFYLQIYENGKLKSDEKWDENVFPFSICEGKLYCVKRDSVNKKLKLVVYQL